ncbi:hypothetical protein [Streptomyces corynorhini]|uniref:Uncharacterized protein n=1 Tax=Streptomyces corynorhini TaxID=2282652 RepID=A0A370BDV9_9ACTN|nr:hypothetical protein [Streptomyces corynorhini]RDG39957.1 hypothetical protein DVH02_01215 [Streptomyces corynorhini]
MDELRKRLRETAHTHTPDRERMLARIERGMSVPETAFPRPSAHRPAPWLRVAAVTAVAVGALGAGTFAVVSVTKDERPLTVATTPEPAHPPSAPGPSSSSSGRADPSSGAGRSDVPPPAATDRTGSPGPRDGYLRSDGTVDPHSNTYWAQSNITVRTERPLTSLTVELSVAQTGGVRETGSWRSLPQEDFTVTVGTGPAGALVFRWTLKDGVTVPAGEHVFAGQYDHAEGGRDAAADRYRAEATGSDLAAEVGGGFAPAS